MFNESKPNDVHNWVCVVESSDEIYVKLMHSYLSNYQIPSNILNKRDTAYALTIGEMSKIYLYVPKEFESKANQLIKSFEAAEEDDNEGA